MKIWTRVKLKEKDKTVEVTAKALTNYLYSIGPISDFFKNYQISTKEKNEFKKFTADRVAGLLYLYFSKDTKRINDIINKYNLSEEYEIFPELEGYIDK